MDIYSSFRNVKFPSRVIREARDMVVASASGEQLIQRTLSASRGSRTFFFDKTAQGEAEFLQFYDTDIGSAILRLDMEDFAFEFNYFNHGNSSKMEVAAAGPSRVNVEAVIDYFEKESEFHADETITLETITLEMSEWQTQPRIFLGHGRSPQWRDLKDHLSHHHGYEVIAYETGSRSGHTIRDILEEMSEESTLAFLVMTAEDEMADGSKQARPNVIHEVGLFQGKLGFSRAIAIIENGCSDFSNLQGIQQIRYGQGNIREVFGDVLAVVKREFET